MPPFHGTDTSNNQGPGVVNIGPEVQALGGHGWWHKATQGSGYRDRYWPACRQNRIDVGLRYGGPYHWLSASSSVPDQFKNFRDYVGGLTVGEGIQLDLEENGLTDSQVIEAVELWENEWPGRVFHYMGFYFGAGMVHRMAARFGADWRWWLAWYAGTYPSQVVASGLLPVMWQYAGGASGIQLSVGRVDSNEIRDLTALEAISGYGGSPPPPPPPPGGTTMMHLWPCNDAGAAFLGDFDGRIGHTISRVSSDEWSLYTSIGVPVMPHRSRNDFKHLILVGAPPEAWRMEDPQFQGWDDSYFRWVTRNGGGLDLNAVIAAVRNDIKSRL